MLRSNSEGVPAIELLSVQALQSVCFLIFYKVVMIELQYSELVSSVARNRGLEISLHNIQHVKTL